MELFNLFAKLVLDSSEFRTGVAEAQGEAEDLASSIEDAGDSFDDLSESMIDSGESASENADQQRDLGSSIGDSTRESDKGGVSLENYSKILGKVKAAAASMVAVKIAKWFWDTTDAVAEAGDHIDKMSQKMNMSAKAYQEWSFIAEHAGTNIDSLRMSMKTLATQSEKNAEAFDKLGMSYDDIHKMSQEELFEETIKALQKVEDTTERTVLATELLGRGAMELGPLFNSSADDIDSMKSRMEDLGGVMSDRLVKNSAAYADAMTDLQTAVQGAKNNIADLFMEFNTNVILTAANALGALNRAFDKLIPDTFEEELENAETSLEAFKTSYEHFLEVGDEAAAQDALNQITYLQARIDELSAKVEANKESAESNVNAQKEKLAELRAAYDETYESVSTSLEGWFGAFDNASYEITTSSEEMMTNLQSQLDFWNSYEDNLKTLADAGFGDLVTAIESMGPAGAQYADVLAGMESAGEDGQAELQALSDKMQEVEKARGEAADTVTAIKFTDNTDIALNNIEAVKKTMANIDGMTSTVYIDTVERGGSGYSHAGGIAYVPYHNYAATLHEGERVLTKEENRSYSSDREQQRNSRPIELTIETPLEIDGQIVAKKSFKYLLDEKEFHGGSLINA